MTPEHFTYWLKNYVPSVGAHPTPQQWAEILEKLLQAQPGEPFLQK